MDYSKVRGKRCELRITQKEMADKLGIASPTYTNKENGKFEFTLLEAYKICQIFGCKFEDIFLPKMSNKQ